MHTPSNVLVLSDFSLTSEEMRVKSITIGKDILKINPNANFYWDAGTSAVFSNLSNVSAVFDHLNILNCDTIICNVCEDHASTLYAYIRELARMCGIQVITAKELHDIAEEY